MTSFRTSRLYNIRDYQFYFNFPSVETSVKLQAVNFLRKFSAVVNLLRETIAQVAIDAQHV